MIIIHSFYQLAGVAGLLLATLPALVRGGWPERVGAAAMILAWVASGFVQNGIQLMGLQVGVMVVDLSLLAALLTLALTSNRWWPMWACGFHGLGVLLHLAVVLDNGLWSRAIFIGGTIFSVLTLLALFVGLLVEVRPRLKIAATD